MNNQTENYIILKPIAERFNEVAKSISDDEIKVIIKNELREQIKNAFNFGLVGEIVDNFIIDNTEKIAEMAMESINERMKIK